jgi:outer membrane lipoprotein-sorting protein
MKRYQAFPLLFVLLSTGLTGCYRTTHIVQKTQAPEIYRTASVEQLQKEVSDRDAAIKTLNATVLITATTGGGKEGEVIQYHSFRGFITVQKPHNLRVIMTLPVLGSKALDMVSNGDTFTMMNASTHGDVWRQGSNTVTKRSKNGLENLRPPVFFDSLLVPGVGADELVTLTESTRVLDLDNKHHEAIEEPDYELTIMKKKGGNPAILQRTRTIHINRVTMLPFQQDIYNADGQVETLATYDHYQPYGDQQFPALITIKRPLDEYSLKVEITKLALNEKLDDDQFELPIPPGVKVLKMD